MQAIADDDNRPSEIPDEGRPSCVVVLPPPKPPRKPCTFCGRMGSRRRRRGLCIACVRKLADHAHLLPPAPPPGPAPGSPPSVPPADPLLSLMDRLTPAQRTRARLYLGELAAREPAETP